jgi:hypothetical protein
VAVEEIAQVVILFPIPILVLATLAVRVALVTRQLTMVTPMRIPVLVAGTLVVRVVLATRQLTMPTMVAIIMKEIIRILQVLEKLLYLEHLLFASSAHQPEGQLGLE